MAVNNRNSPCLYQNAREIPLYLATQSPARQPVTFLRRIWKYETHGNCISRNSAIRWQRGCPPRRTGAVASRRASGSANQRARRGGVFRGGANETRERSARQRVDIQRGAERSGRFEKSQAG